jgi:hypothetical protein
LEVTKHSVAGEVRDGERLSSSRHVEYPQGHPALVAPRCQKSIAIDLGLSSRSRPTVANAFFKEDSNRQEAAVLLREEKVGSLLLRGFALRIDMPRPPSRRIAHRSEAFPPNTARGPRVGIEQ